MNLPPFVYTLRFWEALSWLVAGLLALLVQFGVIGPEFAMSAAAVLALFLMVLKLFGIEPELRLRARLKALEFEISSIKRDLWSPAAKSAKKSK